MEAKEYQALRAVEDDHWWFRSLNELVVRQVRDTFPAKRPQVLDAGCGTGGLLARLSEIAAVEGIDGSEIAVELCTERGIGSVRRDDLNAPTLAPEVYDAITCVDVLYHSEIKDDAAVLKHLVAALRPGGLLFLHLPAYEWLRSDHDRRVHTRKRYRMRDVRRLIEDAGLRIGHASHRVAALLPAIVVIRLVSARFRGRSDDVREATSDVRPVPAFINAPLLLLCRMENAVSRRIGLPFGSSIYVVGRKPE